MNQQTTALLQSKINKRSEQRLQKEITQAFEHLIQLYNRCEDNPAKFRLKMGDGHYANVGQDGVATIAFFTAISAMKNELQSLLLDRYIEEDTKEFLDQVDRVAELTRGGE